MKIAIITDIHSNLYALNAVLEDIAERGIQTIYCLGDLVGYHTRPNEVIEKIRTLNIPCILGNHDEKILIYSEKAHKDSTLEPKDVVTKWTYEQISPENLDFLRQLPATMTIDFMDKKLLLAHGSPSHISEYVRKEDSEKQEEIAHSLQDCDAVVFGHTHDCYRKKVKDKVFINAGSVGRMKDGDNRGCYTIISEDLEVEFVRLPYDFEKLASEILTSPLPDKFAEVIRTGIEVK